MESKKTHYGIPENQINEINNLLLEYSDGNYSAKGEISESQDEIDTIIMGVNMLGEELLDTTVSRDYFSSIYNAVVNMVFVVNEKGFITSSNKMASDVLEYTNEEFLKTALNDYLHADALFEMIEARLKKKPSFIIESAFQTAQKKVIPVECSCSKIIDRNEKFKGYLLIAQDIRERKATEKLIIRTVIDTQEKEQKRVAEDLHDSLGQELSTVKLMFSNLHRQLPQNSKEISTILSTCKEMLDNSIAHLRNICFDLMPSSLESGGVNAAISELQRKLSAQQLITFHYEPTPNLVRHDLSLEVALYRLAQEFINNSIKHSKAKDVFIELKQSRSFTTLTLSDNGCGFAIDKIESSGRGLENMKSRLKGFDGSCSLYSEPGKGTKMVAKIPLNSQ